MISTCHSLARLAAVSLAGVSLMVLPVRAESINVTIILAGEAFDGPPAYEIRYGDREIAKGSVENAIDTAKEGTIYKLADWQDYQKVVSIPIDSEDLGKNLSLTVNFTNDKWGGAGTGMDRNLYVLSAEVGSVKVAAQDIKVLDKAQPKDDATGPRGARLGNNSSVAVIAPPATGWLPASAQAVSGTQQQQTEAGAPAQTASAAPASPETETAQPGATPATSPQIEAAAPATPEKVPNAPKSKASTNTATPNPKAKCAPKTLSISGFPLNRSDLPGDAVPQLKTLAELTAKEGCKLEITGYSSIAGPRRMNEALASVRANAVADFLKEQGIGADRINVVTGGETRRFGPKGALNRRVTVEVVDGN